jgi:hypothetical protein
MLEHILLALAIQLSVGALLRSLSAGAAAASAWAIAREITQAEYRWIEQFGSGLRSNMPWWGGLDPIVWRSIDPWLDWLAPSVTVVLVAVLARMMMRGRSCSQIQKNGGA